MFKIIIISSLWLILTNCTGPGTALLGPAVTGFTTKSVARSSVSFGTNQIVNNLKDKSKKPKNKTFLKFNN